MSGSCFLTFARMVYSPRMNKNDLNAIKDIVDSPLGTHLASVHEELTDLRRDMDERFSEVDVRFTAVERALDRLEAKIDHVDEKLRNFETERLTSACSLKSASSVSKSNALEPVPFAYSPSRPTRITCSQ